MTPIRYFKRLQRASIYHYAQLDTYRQPPLSEVVNFLNAVPIIQQQEYDLERASDRIEYDAFFEGWESISANEFKVAYERATADEFQVYVDGKPVGQ